MYSMGVKCLFVTILVNALYNYALVMHGEVQSKY